jgi:hypothetical protein
MQVGEMHRHGGGHLGKEDSSIIDYLILYARIS